jgi:hypothetical protein
MSEGSTSTLALTAVYYFYKFMATLSEAGAEQSDGLHDAATKFIFILGLHCPELQYKASIIQSMIWHMI